MGATDVRIPEGVVEALKLPPGEVEAEPHKELAVALYARAARWGSGRRGSWLA